MLTSPRFINIIVHTARLYVFLSRLTSPSDLQSATSPFRRGKMNQKRDVII